MRKNVLRTAIVLISAAVMVYAAHRIYQEYSEYREGADSYSVLETYIKEPQSESVSEESKPEQDEMSEDAIIWPVVDFAALESINSDCVAWIRIDGTEIDYPVVQGHDNSFYLKHLFDGESAGSIWPLLLMISRSRLVSARRTRSISILLWMSFWSCAESWIAGSCGICCKAKRKTAIIRRCISVLAAHLPKNSEPSVGQGRTGKAFPAWRSWYQPTKQISCLLPTAVPARLMKRD